MRRAKDTTRSRWAAVLALLVVGLTGCGDDAAPSAPRRRTPVGAAVTPAAGGAGVGAPVAAVSTYPKVDDEFRRELSARDFATDNTGDINRDPFRSYLVETPASAQGKAVKDDCDGRMVADKYGLRDLKLIGIIHQGTRTFAMFTDSKRFGHKARRGDCLSKDKARLKEIGDDRIVLDINQHAAPGQPPAPARQEVWRLHPEDLELDEEP